MTAAHISAVLIAFSLTAFAAQTPVVRTGDPVKRGLAESVFPRIQKLADGVYSYEQLRSAGAERFTTVSLFVVTPAGVLVADGQGSVEETKRMVDEIAKITSQPITHIVIGSDHGDHTAGNAAFPAGATYYIHPASMAAMGKSAPAKPVLVTGKTALSLGGKEIQVLFLGRAHTGGDLSVYLPQERILFMSEAYLNRIFPAMRSAFPSEWVKTIDAAMAMPVNIYVPGHGFVESPEILKEELATFRRALLYLIAEGKRLHTTGLSEDESVAMARFGEFQDWTLRSSQSGIAIRRVYMELEGKLPPPIK